MTAESVLAGKVVLVTGGGTGLGQGIAARLAAEGAAVAIMGRTQKTLAQTAAQLAEAGHKCIVCVGSIAVPDSVEEAITEVERQLGPIDVLVNNASLAHYASFLGTDIVDWKRVLETNLTGAFLMTQRVARRMKSAGRGGSIVNIASIDAQGTDGHQVSYGVAKTGIIGLTRIAATELAKYGIRVNAVSPGWTRTDMITEHVTAKALDHLTNDFRRVPMRRLVEIDEVARAVAFLASSAASGITGVDLPVDCGTLSNLYIYETLPSD